MDMRCFPEKKSIHSKNDLMDPLSNENLQNRTNLVQ